MNVHRPFSTLAFSPSEYLTTSFTTPTISISPTKTSRSVHTARALKAAEMQTKLLSIPCKPENHHLFTLCITASLSAAQIAACNILLEDHALSIARDRLRLSIGHLNQLGSLWPLAKKMAKEVKWLARQELTMASTSAPAAVEANPEMEIEIPRDEVIWPINPSADIDIYSGLVLPMNWDQMTYQSSSSSSLQL